MKKKKDFWLEQIRKNWDEERRGRGWGECKKNQKVNKACLLELLEYKLREEKDANCEKLYCCGRKSCESCEIFLATFSSRKFFFAQQFLPIK